MSLLAAQIFSRLWIDGIDDRQIQNVPAGGMALFGEPWGNGGETRYVENESVIEFDVRDGNRGISSYIHRGLVAKPMNKPRHVAGNFTTLVRTFPLLHDTGIITQAELTKRAFKENPYGPSLTQFERARKKARTIFEDIIIDHLYMMEKSSWQMIKTGKMDLIASAGASDQIDTKRPAGHTLTVSASWATAGTDLLGDVDAACTVGVEAGVGAYDIMVGGSSIPGYIANNTAIKALAGIQGAGTSGFELIWFGDNFKPDARFSHMIANGYNPICQLKTLKGRKVNVFTYEGTYVDGSTTYYLTANEVCYFRSNAACDRYFGPPEKLNPTEQMITDWDQVFGFSPESITLPENIDATPGVIDRNSFSCDIMRTPDNNAYEITCQAAPMFITKDTKKFAYTADVTSP